MKFKIERKAWRPAKRYGDTAISQWNKGDLANLVTFLKAAGIEVPRIINLRIKNTAGVEAKPPQRRKAEPRRAYRRRVRKWRQKSHGSIGKMRRAKKEQQIKEQRWAVLREQGFPLRDPEALIWFIKTNMWSGKLVEYGYLRHSVLLEAAGGVLPPGIDFDELYASMTIDGRERHNARNGRKTTVDSRDLKQRVNDAARAALHEAYRKAKFRLRNARTNIDLHVNNHAMGENRTYGPMMKLEDETRSSRWGKNRHYTNATVRVNLSWYRKVFLPGLANAAGEGSLVLDIVTLSDGEKRAIVARQASAHRYALTISHMKFGKNNDGTYWFEEA